MNRLFCFGNWDWSVPFVCGLQYSEETLAVFKSYKLDDMQASKRKLEDLRASGGDHVYFAKFLTSEKVRKLFDCRQKWCCWYVYVQVKNTSTFLYESVSLSFCSWWTCSWATATSGGTFCCSTSSCSSTWRVRSSLKGESSVLCGAGLRSFELGWRLSVFALQLQLCPERWPGSLDRRDFKAGLSGPSPDKLHVVCKRRRCHSRGFYPFLYLVNCPIAPASEGDSSWRRQVRHHGRGGSCSGAPPHPKSIKAAPFLTAWFWFYLWQRILSTEENWNSWKNEGCPSFVKERLNF